LIGSYASETAGTDANVGRRPAASAPDDANISQSGPCLQCMERPILQLVNDGPSFTQLGVGCDTVYVDADRAERKEDSAVMVSASQAADT